LDLTEKGLTADLREIDIHELFKRVHDSLPKSTKAFRTEKSETDLEEEPPGESASIDYRSGLMEMLSSLPAHGFEMLCQHLLREAGFREVVVTGRSGDGGIGGHGVLKINPFVRSKCFFNANVIKALSRHRRLEIFKVLW
jgi:restriction system protein